MAKKLKKFERFDQVAMICPKSGIVKYGLVLETNVKKSESESTEKKRLAKSLKIWWHPEGPEEIVLCKKLALVDRYMEPAHKVSRVSNIESNMLGRCLNINMYVTIKILNTNKVIENINSQYITNAEQFDTNICVINETMHVGDIMELQLNVTLASDDGSVFILNTPNKEYFVSLRENDIFEDEPNIFHYGKIFKMHPIVLLKAKFITISSLMNNKLSLWRSCNKKCSNKFGSKWINVCVQDIAVTAVGVNWFSRLSDREITGEDNFPQYLYEGDDLKKLSTFDVFGFHSYTIGQKCWYTIKETDNLLTEKQWRTKCSKILNVKRKSWPKRNKKNILYKIFSNTQDNQKSSTTKNMQTIKIKKKGKNPIHIYKSYRLKKNRMPLIKYTKEYKIPKISLKVGSKVVADICCTKSFVDVLWEDGSQEMGISTTDLYPTNYSKSKLFVRDIVTKTNEIFSNNVYGVIESINNTTLSCHVQWFEICKGKPPFYESFSIPTETTDINTYYLKLKKQFQFKYNELVKNICPITNQCFLIGQVLNVELNGKISVIWVNGERAECWPQNISVLINLNDLDNDGEIINIENNFFNTRMSLASVKRSKESLKNDIQTFKQSKLTEINLLQLLKHSYTTILLFLQASKYNKDLCRDMKIKIMNNRRKNKFQMIAFDINEDEIQHWHLNNVKNEVEKLIEILENDNEIAEEVSFKALITDISNKFEKVLPDILYKFNIAIKNLKNGKTLLN